MPALTRRRYPERTDCWHVYYGGVHAGTIAIRSGIPHDEDPWEWACGFYPGSRAGECTSGTAPTLDEARAGFEEAWRVEPDRGRFSGMARSAGLDRAEIRDVETRREDAVAEAKLADEVSMRRNF